MHPRIAILSILTTLFVSLTFAEDFKTISGKIYKDATVIHVEADGIVLRTKSGISKIYFVELPKDVQERFHYAPGAPAGRAVMQRTEKPETNKHADVFVPDPADRFAQRVAERLDERESILKGKHTPGSAELMMIREFNFHKVFLAGIALIAVVLFAIVWSRFK